MNATPHLYEPTNGRRVPTKSALETAAWRMPNGSRFVILVDESEAAWEAYCAECLARSRAHAPRKEATP